MQQGDYRTFESLEKSPAAGLGEQRRPDGGGREDKPDDHAVESDNAEVAWPAPGAADLLMSPRRHPFPQCHQHEDAGEGTQADQGFVGK